MTERTQWTDPALNREFERVYKSINGTPAKMVRLEEGQKALANIVQDLREDHERDTAAVTVELQALRSEIKGEKWTRTQVISAVAVLASFIGSFAAAAAVIFG